MSKCSLAYHVLGNITNAFGFVLAAEPQSLKWEQSVLNSSLIVRVCLHAGVGLIQQLKKLWCNDWSPPPPPQLGILFDCPNKSMYFLNFLDKLRWIIIHCVQCLLGRTLNNVCLSKTVTQTFCLFDIHSQSMSHKECLLWSQTLHFYS